MTNADKVEYAAQVARGERGEIEFDSCGNPLLNEPELKDGFAEARDATAGLSIRDAAIVIIFLLKPDNAITLDNVAKTVDTLAAEIATRGL